MNGSAYKDDLLGEGVLWPSRRVYLASRFGRQAEMVSIAEELAWAGAVVTSRWLSSPAPVSQVDLDGGSASFLAKMDLEDLQSSNLCIAFTESADSATKGRGGRHVELGIALGLGLDVIVVGPREHIFHALDSIVWASSWERVRDSLVSAGGGATAPAALRTRAA